MSDSKQYRKEIENDPLLNEILEKSRKQIKLFDNFKPLTDKGRIEVVFLYGYFYLRTHGNPRNPALEGKKMGRFNNFLIFKRKALGLKGFFTFNLVRDAILQRSKDYNRHLASISESSMNTHSIYYSAIYKSPLKTQLDENVDLMDSIAVATIVADMVKQLKAY